MFSLSAGTVPRVRIHTQGTDADGIFMTSYGHKHASHRYTRYKGRLRKGGLYLATSRNEDMTSAAVRQVSGAPAKPKFR